MAIRTDVVAQITRDSGTAVVEADWDDTTGRDVLTADIVAVRVRSTDTKPVRLRTRLDRTGNHTEEQIPTRGERTISIRGRRRKFDDIDIGLRTV